MFNPLQHQQGVWTKPRLQRYFPLHLSQKEKDIMNGKQLPSIWADNNNDHITSNIDTSTSDNFTIGMSMDTSAIGNKDIIELSTCKTKCELSYVADDIINSILPTTIDIDDQTTIHP